ncbi:penicillin-binding protein 2 [Nonlabens dokdonensis]|jgi:penicillin-binding protein 2|uniref:Cell division protein FtsI/penicillin-binding protein n=2 Tax=Nonlabens dokdonensis TaxID=328515 RepID=L7WA64_NONDD|nr:penicillin-binding protein 2 [Nonlabens dokdonensis]AGC77107.1 cell division protein FtsI/penicillin-binding protein [Nonlabens dokdonensis DSW-6]PZX41066.1 penicillin-binding protein 2 [Nonlabens dokdonensis]
MRKLLLFSIVTLVGIIFLGRMIYLQLIISDELALEAENNSVKTVYNYPERGFIYDRNGKLMVANQVAYDVMVIPRETGDVNITELSKLLRIEESRLEKKLITAKKWSEKQASVIIPQLTQEEYAPLQEQLRKFPGFYIQRRSLRKYLVDHSASVLGYIREVNQGTIKKDDYYVQGDLAGKSGIELQYEKELRGEKGYKKYTRDHYGRAIESYKNGSSDVAPVAGTDLTVTLDKDLQEYAERLMVNKRGGIVAIEPKTGEILTLVTAPNYDPSLLMGRDRSKNINAILRDTIRLPDVNRVLQGQYAPGSPFKVINALVGLQEGVISPKERFSCNHGYNYGGKKKLGCHAHASPLAMNRGIAESCNSYFAQVYRRIIESKKTAPEGMDVWHDHVTSFGLGDYLGYDLPVGQPGRIPDGDYYTSQYKYKWYAPTTISNAIGQGEVAVTPIQLANMTAAIANRGFYYRPHIIKKMNGEPISNEKYTEKNFTTIDAEHFEPVIEGMNEVYQSGTAKYVQVPGIEICGKTGTVENFTKINGERKQLTDHSVFIAFAPKDDPKIAIAVFIENGYWGSRYAAKIASLLIEKHIKGEITRTDLEKYLLSHSLEYEYAKRISNQPFKINEAIDQGLITEQKEKSLQSLVDSLQIKFLK